MKRQFGLRRKAVTPLAKAVQKLDKLVSESVRAHYEPMGCATCGRKLPYSYLDCGHFVRREAMSTRFSPKNLLAQCRKCNRFEGGRSWEFGKALDEIWGEGTAARMKKLGQKTKLWDINQLENLMSAAKKGWLTYLKVYSEYE